LTDRAAGLAATLYMARSQTAPGHGLTALGASEIQSPLSQLIPSFFHLPLRLNQNKKHLSLSLKEKITSLGGRLCPLILVQPRASPVSLRRPLPFPLGISSISLPFHHGFYCLGFIISRMRIQFWTMDSLD
jgi:hypothetical protein